MRLTNWLAAGCMIVALLGGASAEEAPTGLGGGQRGPGVPDFYVRAGYRVELVAEKLGQCRFMEFDDHGNLFLSQPEAGSILLLHKTANGTYASAGKLVSDLKTVQGMCFHAGWLWFTQSGAVHKLKLKPDGTADGAVVTVLAHGALAEGGHWWRSILVSDDAFWTSIGDSGNTDDDEARDGVTHDREKIWKYALDGQTRTLWCAGIRNTEKLRFRPGTTELWGADHGSDNFGAKLGENRENQPITDVVPPDEINCYVEGGFYGHPFLIGNRIPRLEYQSRPDILKLAASTIIPAWQLGAHWAPNASMFLSTDFFPGQKGDLFVGLHGSWNSSKKVGYGIERIFFDADTGKPYGAWRIVSTLGSGKDAGRVLGRPCDVTEEPGGALLFSDDGTNRLYRITKPQ